ncbi:MAG: response regulator [Candidatus Rokubacteria bacterium]|nr:response regulator [Candidatus Rokubacteria bacterium]
MDALGRILVVDDEEPVREVLTEYFGAQGYAVEAVASGADALAAVKRGRPDLVLLDVRMPGIDGVETLRRLRGLDGGVAVIMVTANEDVGLARETLKIGAFDYVAKPFDFAYLDRAVAAALVRTGGPPGVVPEPPGPGGDPWDALTLAVFGAARRMASPGRASTGARLEDAALGAARAARAGRPAEASERLAELELLLTIAAHFGDFAAAERATMEAAVATARRSAPPTR